jgi:hypothetical protein
MEIKRVPEKKRSAIKSSNFSNIFRQKSRYIGMFIGKYREKSSADIRRHLRNVSRSNLKKIIYPFLN